MSVILEKGVVSKDYALSRDIIELFKSVEVTNVNEAVTVLFHAYLLESGFSPKDVSEENKYRYMSKDWNGNGMFKINYVHKCCTAFTCSVSYVFLYNNVSLHGIVCEAACSDTVHMKINVKNYIGQRTDFSDVNNVFCNLEELSKLFKDNFCLPLLNLLHETIGVGHLIGMPGLIDEIKEYILQFLPVESVVSISAVNKNFNDLTKSPLLWKYMYQRDYAKDGVTDIGSSSSDINWKDAYKREYMKRKRNKRSPTFRFRQPFPPFFSIFPDIERDFGINFDPPFPNYDPPFPDPLLPDPPFPNFNPPFPNPLLPDPAFPNYDPPFFRRNLANLFRRKY